MTEPLANFAETPDRLPALFVGHGSPMNALEDNEFSRAWVDAGPRAPDPGRDPVHLGPLGNDRQPGHRDAPAAHDL